MNKRQIIIQALDAELREDPSLAPEILSLVTKYIIEGIKAAQKELDIRSRVALELCIEELGLHPQKYTIPILKTAFEIYAPDGLQAGESQAVENAWKLMIAAEKLK